MEDQTNLTVVDFGKTNISARFQDLMREEKTWGWGRKRGEKKPVFT